jgi:glycosyltransferase involved in cell wall biosynthesis
LSRVAVVGPAHPFKGGVAHHTMTLAQRLGDAGHEVEIVSWSRQYPARLYPGEPFVQGEPELDDMPPIRRGLAWNRPDSWWREARRLRSRDLVVFAHVTPVQAPAYRVMLRCLRRARPETVVICHNVLPHERRALDRRLVASLLRSADRIIAHSSQQADLVRTLTHRPVTVAPLAAHMPRAFAPTARREGVQHRVLFFGLVRPYKGLDVLLRALAEGPADLQLRVAGEFWGGVNETRALVDELGLEDRVELRPEYVSSAEVPGLFGDVDALVLPYRTATGSQGVDLAFRFGVPVIATRAGSLPDKITEGVDGIVVEPDDVSALAGALREFYVAGRPEELRGNVRSTDATDDWQRYLHAVVGREEPGGPVDGESTS